MRNWRGGGPKGAILRRKRHEKLKIDVNLTFLCSSVLSLPHHTFRKKGLKEAPHCAIPLNLSRDSKSEGVKGGEGSPPPNEAKQKSASSKRGDENIWTPSLPSILLRETNHRRKNLLLVLFPVLAIGKGGKRKRGRVRRDISWLTASCYFCFRQTQKSSQTVRGTSAKGCHFFVGELSTFIWSERASLTLLLSHSSFHTNPHFLSGLGSTCHTSFFGGEEGKLSDAFIGLVEG